MGESGAMAEISSSPTVSIQSLLYPTTTDPQTTAPTEKTDTSSVTPVVSQDVTVLPTSTRGNSAATLGLTPPRPGGAAEADLLAIRQMLDDMNSDMRDNEIMASAQRKATAMGDALSLLNGLVSNMSEVVGLTVELPKAIAKADEAKLDYQSKQQATEKAAANLKPVAEEYTALTGQIADGNLAIKKLGDQISAKDGAILTAQSNLDRANLSLDAVKNDITSTNQAIGRLQSQYASETNAGKKAELLGQINNAKLQLQQLEGLQQTRQKTVDEASTSLGNLKKERSDLVAAQQTKTEEVSKAQARKDEIEPTKLQLETELRTARLNEDKAYSTWNDAQSYANGIPDRIEQALSGFLSIMDSYTVLASRVAAVSGSPDAGVDAELNALKKDNADALKELWKIMTDSREKLGADAEINNAITSRLQDLDEVRKTKIGLAFSSIFSSLQQALTSLSVLMDPAATSGGNNFSERQPQRMRFSIGGSA
jgi:DNA repair exonuclease SbcCD ATPase subunit